MPILRNHIAFKVIRNITVFLNLEAGVTRGRVPEPGFPASIPTPGERTPERSSNSQEELERIRQRLERENSRLRAELARADDVSGVSPEDMIWIFGSGRTGSTWLSHLMTELEGHILWGEPLVGKLFADLYYSGPGPQQSQIETFILSDPYKDVWLRSIRHFVLDGANARFPEAAKPDNYLLLSEPNGSTGAPLLMEAMPESRMVFLIRDPRDVVASFLAASKKGSWLEARWGRSNTLADQDPDAFVKQRATWFVRNAEKAREAYENHTGPKALVRYEDLRVDTVAELRRIYSTLEIDVDQEKLPEVVKKHSWENIPEDSKGSDKFFRKATPGGWREDLTPEQAKIVESTAAPLIKAFYSTEV
jgi:hypothetical protein